MKENKDAAVLVAIAAGWAIFLVVLAALLPIVTPQSSPTASTPTSSLSTDTGIAPALHQMPQVTLVARYGNSVLIPMSLPALASLVVGLLLWLRVTRKSRWAGVIAWAFAGAVLIGGVIGFVTFFFQVGLAIVPIGVLLLMACNSVAPRHAI